MNYDEIRSARNYLRHEKVYRVVLNKAWGQTPRVNFCEAVNIHDAIDGYEDNRYGVEVLEVRRATVDDAMEMLAQG